MSYHRKIIFSRDVTFDKLTMLKQKDSQENDKTIRTLQQVEFEKVKNNPVSVDETDSDSPSTEDREEVLTQEPSLLHFLLNKSSSRFILSCFWIGSS